MNRISKGLTLVELLIGIVLSSIAVEMCIQIYITVESQFSSMNSQYINNTKQLLIKKTLEDSIKSRGFPCRYSIKKPIYNDMTGTSFDDIFSSDFGNLTIGMSPINNVTSLPAILETNTDDCASGSYCIKKDTDFILIQKASGYSSMMKNSYNQDENGYFTIEENSINNLNSGDFILACDSAGYYLYDVYGTSIDNSNEILKTTFNINHTYYKDSLLNKYLLEIYYIRDTDKIDDSGNQITSLYVYKKDNSSRGISYEVAEGVNDLQLQYLERGSNMLDGSNNLNWIDVTNNVNIDSQNYAAIKISFEIDNKVYDRIVLL